MLLAATRSAGLEPDTFMKEYGPGQYEVTIGPARGVIADQAAMLRELVRMVGERLGRPVTFTPIRDPARAEALFRRALERDPDHPRAKSRLGLR